MLRDDILIQAIIQEVTKAFFVGKSFTDNNGYVQQIPGQLDKVVEIILGQLNVDVICKAIMDKVSVKDITEKATNSINDIVYTNNGYAKVLKDNIRNALAQKIAEKITNDQEFTTKLISGLDLEQMDINVELTRKKT